MTKSDRIKLFKQIVNNLEPTSWNDIQLILDQFELTPLDHFSGNKIDYLYQRLGMASDNDLISLAQHLEIEVVSNIEATKTPAFWQDIDFRMFISHLSIDKVDAQSLKDRLQNFGILGFVAHSDIEPSLEWQLEIELALKTCDAFVALLTPKFHESQWTDQEVGFAIARSIPVFPVNMGLIPYGFLGKYQALPYKDNLDDLAKLIYNLLLKDKRVQKKLAFGILKHLDNSGSFADANERSLLLTEIQFWDQQMINKLKEILLLNSQVSGGWRASSRVKGIISQYQV